MSRLAFVADCHLGNFLRFGGPVERGMNARCALSLGVFRRAATRAHRRDVGVLVVCGDLFDSSRPPPQLIAEVQRVIEGFGGALRFVFLVGNHERESDAPGDHALGPLTPIATVVERPTKIRVGAGWLACLPHRKARSGEWFDEELREALHDAGSAPVVVAMHAGIVDTSTPSFLRSAGTVEAGAVLRAMPPYNIRRVFAGDHHNHRRWGPGGEVTQLGALVPTGFGNAGLDGYGTLAVYDELTRELVIEHLPGPRFVRAPIDTGALALAVERGDRPFVTLTEKTGAETTLFALKAEGLIIDGDVEDDRADGAEEARAAAREALAAEDDAGAALAAFVARMALPAGVSAERVLARAQEHLLVARARAVT